MGIAALITWLATAAGGFYLLGVWLARGGARQRQDGAAGSAFPPPVIFGHFLLAAAGLIVWIVYLAAAQTALAWTAFVILLPVALLGFTMLVRWIPGYRARAAAGRSADRAAPEQAFPVAVVLGHGALAVVTVVLVLLAALGVG